MKRTLLLAVLSLALPLAALADNVDFSNNGGTLTGSSAGLTLTGSMLTEVVGLGGNGPVLGDLGTLSFTTGSLLSGSLATSAVFNAGGSFVITGNGTNGVPNGVIFSGVVCQWCLQVYERRPHLDLLQHALRRLRGF